MGALAQTIEVNAPAQRTKDEGWDEGSDDGRPSGRRALETHLQPGECDHRRLRHMVSRPRAGRSRLVWAEGVREIRETLPLSARLDVHALQGDGPGLQVTADEAPQTGSNGDPVDHEERRPIPGWAEQDRSHHQLEGCVHADRALQMRVW